MGTARTAWHVLLAALLDQRGPRSFEYRSEVPLSSEPLRGDFLLLRRGDTSGPDPTAATVRRLWELLPRDTLLELKSVGRPYRARNLHRLLSYLFLYHAERAERLPSEADLAGVVIVPARTPTLYTDALALRLRWRDLGGGYARLEGAAEDDDLLRLLGHDALHSLEAQQWWSQQVGSRRAGVAMEQLEEYEAVVTKILTTLQPETMTKVLANLPPEQRLAGLAPEQMLLSLPDEALRALSDAYLDTLSEPTRSAIRARLGR